MTRKPAAYRPPSTIMACLRCWPARKALMRMDGMGNLPLLASSVAAIRPSVAAGSSASASAAPTNGTRVASDSTAMNMKNSPDMASGCPKKVLMPSFTQVRPVRAGTILSFMGSVERAMPKAVGVAAGLLVRQTGAVTANPLYDAESLP